MGKSVLIVDDQPGIRMLLEEVIKNEGFHVLQATTGQEAIDMVKHNLPDVMFVDLKLPIKDGYTVIRELEEEGHFIPTILMSGLAEEEIGKQNFSSVETMISKPFNIQDIRELVIQYL
ncbi:response regulator [Pontibacillus salicampi]|uniref:Response regulator n=1 Tax=Pontibacillus salicampi TaxID=1449801 RepID=A0ABV6LS22_9BACI